MSLLVTLAGQAGISMVEKVLSQKLGDTTGQLAGEFMREIADRAGVEPGELEGLADTRPGIVIDAMKEVERASPEVIALYAAGVQLQMQQLAAEQSDPVWMRAWRPGWMYLLGFFWVWQIVLLHVLNAVFKVALPPMPFDILVTLTGIFMALYMGGHTLLRATAKAGDK
jgi:hypothetical protein